ncbi:diguanylate cyclase domain-containing protein, partial [Ilyobacter sp.]|uniref:diguanylate cyclase domain-containing protein n=1 Tax=Ilyobacter sp. TaxID=3100343 RepID=UPI0035612D98
MKKNSVAKKNVIVLILSLMPFVIGLSYSLYRSSDRDYFSKAINMAGSQRMRTILIANYAHQIYNQDFKLDKKEFALIDELYLYKEYFEALKYGNSSLDMKPNNFQDIKNKLEELSPLVDNYIENVNDLILYTSQKNDMRSILVDSLKIKNGFHEVTELYQLHNDLYIKRQKTIDTIMIMLAAGITIGGLFLTGKIRQQEYHANFDALTKLKNRHNLISYIEGKSSVNFSIYFIDLNKFKIINDTYGHEIGDEILVGVSKRLV